ncbi:MAG: YqgE/AlgH family protein [Chlamydiales bacterium]|nr:YqgE/AlgH family protein [Chlamydiales bacterium]
MDSIPYSHLEKGTFLIATPDVESGIFFRSVLLLCEHSPNGSFGIVINKNLELELPEEILSLEQLNNANVGIRAGGPIQTNQMMLVHSSSKIPEQTIEICEGVYLGGDLQFLQDAIIEENGPALRLCFGYAGWQAGQLEREFLDSGWFICPASSKHIFETAPEKLWQELLRELGGRYATLSMIPEDLTLN